MTLSERIKALRYRYHTCMEYDGRCLNCDEESAIATELDRLAEEWRAQKMNEPGTPMRIRAWVCDQADQLAKRKVPSE